MPQDLGKLSGWRPRDAPWPHITCPFCGDGFLELELLIDVPTTRSQRRRDHEAWEPSWIDGAFHGTLVCARDLCAEKVVVVGDLKVEPTGEHYTEMIRLKYTRPALKVVSVPESTPPDIKQMIDSAGQILWTDPSAAANRLRSAIELLLNHHGVKRYPVVKGRRVTLTTHARIEIFQEIDKQAGDALMAVKWIGNVGSHQTDLDVLQVLEGAEMLGYALKLLYDKTELQIQRRIQVTNQRRGRARSTRRRGSS